MGDTAALVLLSGGLGSVVSLFDAKACYEKVEAITLWYGQRNQEEVAAAREICWDLGVEWHLCNMLGYGNLLGASLTEEQFEVRERYSAHVETVAPGSIAVFLSIAGSYAAKNKIPTIVTGLCRAGHTGAPAYRVMTLDSFEQFIFLSTNWDVAVSSPLMDMTKREVLELAKRHGDICWKAVGKSVTCLHGKRPGCGQCQPCLVRLRGFQELNLGDPGV